MASASASSLPSPVAPMPSTTAVPVIIPSKDKRRGVPAPDPSLRSGASLIEGLTWASYESLPDSTGDAPIETNVTANGNYPNPYIIERVDYAADADQLQPPDSLWETKWIHPKLIPTGVAKANNFLEVGIQSACNPSFVLLADVVATQLSINQMQFDMGVHPQAGVGPGEHKINYMLSFDGVHQIGLELKSSLSLNASCWHAFPFAGEVKQKSLSQLDGAAQRVLAQIIYYASVGQAVTEMNKRKLLMALSIPPLRLHYIYIDLDQRRVKVFANAVDYEYEQYNPNLGKTIVDPDAWRAYWMAMTWFFCVAAAFTKPKAEWAKIKEAHEAVKPADRWMPLDCLDKIGVTIAALGEAPPLNLWVRLSIWRAQWAHRLMTYLINPLHALWITLIWQAMGTPSVVREIQFLKLSQGRRLDLRKDSSSLYFSCPATLPDPVGKWSASRTKCFYAYPKLNLFVKIFTCRAHGEFVNEVQIFNHLSQIQGKGIPTLYSSGNVLGRDEFYLLMSYEGEPLVEWDEASRRQVADLVCLLHKYQVHHHDVARRNVMVDASGTFTIVGFEEARVDCTAPGCTEDADLGIHEDMEYEEWLG